MSMYFPHSNMRTATFELDMLDPKQSRDDYHGVRSLAMGGRGSVFGEGVGSRDAGE